MGAGGSDDVTAPVFISHSSKDAARVRALVEALERLGLGCWMSERDIPAGDNYGDSIVEAIERAGAMVLVFSDNANNSDEIKKEIALASQRRITVVPVRIAEVTPSKAFRYELATRNWIDLFPNWDQGVAKVAERLATILEAEVAIPGPPPRPPQSGRTWLYALLGAALILVAGGAWYLTRGPLPAPPAATPLARTTAQTATTTPSEPAAKPSAPAASPPSGTNTPGSAPTSPALPSPTTTPSAAGAPTNDAPTPTPTPSATSDAQAPAQTPMTEPGAEAAIGKPPSPEASAQVRPGPASVLLGSPALQPNDPGGEVFRDCEGCPEMVVIPAGKSMIGTPIGESGRQSFEASPHPVSIAKPFALGRYAITFAEWDACYSEGGCGNRHLGDLDFGRGRRPAIFASWTEAQLFVDWLRRKTGKAYRLPTESEWEYAARGCGRGNCAYSPFWFGPIKPEFAVYDWRRSYQGSAKADPPLKTLPVDRGAPNGFGLYNILGNVRQWTQDCWNPQAPSAPSDGSATLTGDCTARVTRGGSWADEPARLRAGARDWQSVDEGSEKIGLRIARDLVP